MSTQTCLVLFPGLHAVVLAVMQATKAGRGGLGTRLHLPAFIPDLNWATNKMTWEPGVDLQKSSKIKILPLILIHKTEL